MRRLEWRPRASPLRPAAALALDGATAQQLDAALAALGAERQERLRRTTGPAGAVLLTGCMEDLPWVDGLAWLGVDARAPALWLPAHLEPSLPPDLLALACARRAPGGRRWLLWPRPALLWALRA